MDVEVARVPAGLAADRRTVVGRRRVRPVRKAAVVAQLDLDAVWNVARGRHGGHAQLRRPSPRRQAARQEGARGLPGHLLLGVGRVPPVAGEALAGEDHVRMTRPAPAAELRGPPRSAPVGARLVQTEVERAPILLVGRVARLLVAVLDTDRGCVTRDPERDEHVAALQLVREGAGDNPVRPGSRVRIVDPVARARLTHVLGGGHGRWGVRRRRRVLGPGCSGNGERECQESEDRQLPYPHRGGFYGGTWPPAPAPEVARWSDLAQEPRLSGALGTRLLWAILDSNQGPLPYQLDSPLAVVCGVSRNRPLGRGFCDTGRRSASGCRRVLCCPPVALGEPSGSPVDTPANGAPATGRVVASPRSMAA